ncbi:hypothetical protein GRJ2_002601500 [Grus japonensis]|uniref:Uncharacterized protein n=1 Tax=Grus japonensis TaxID=30415 RepID=A0ABC9XUD0_GRUJA
MEDRGLAAVAPSVEEEVEAQGMEEEEEVAQAVEAPCLEVATALEDGDRAPAVVVPSVEEEEVAQAVEAPCLEVATALEDGDRAPAVADAVPTVEG